MSVETREPIIFVSTPRSGSSWLSRILRMHPELDVFTHNTLHTQSLYMLYPIRTLNPFGDDRIEEPSAFDALLGPARRAFARRYFRASAPGRTLVLASPTNVEFLPLLSKAFPTARYVHLRRDPVDVVASFRKFLEYNGGSGVGDRFRKHRHHGVMPATRASLAHLFHSLRWARLGESGYVGTRPSGFQRAVRTSTLEFLCWYYIRLEQQIGAAMTAVPGTRRHALTYEQLCGDCEETLRSLCGFMGIAADERFLRGASAGVRHGSIGRSRAAFTEAELDMVERLVGGRRSHLGSSEADVCAISRQSEVLER